jgi:hypothetical protein
LTSTSFIAAVEVLRRPELAGVPLIVGGRGGPRERAVVSTASYEARAFGVGSGMSLRLAARKALGRGVGRGADRRPGGVRPPGAGRGARGHPAALLGGHRRQQDPGEDRHRVRQATPGVPADGGQLVRGHGPPPHDRVVGCGAEHLGAAG